MSASENWRSSANWRAAGSPSNAASSPGAPAGGSSNWRGKSSRNNNNNAGGDGDAAVAEGRRIYVGNLAYSVKPEDVEALLQAHSCTSYDKIHISVDPFTGRNPGYCFVEFGAREDADRALGALGGAEVLGRAIKVGPCLPKGQRGPGQGQDRGRDRDRDAERGGERRSGGWARERRERDGDNGGGNGGPTTQRWGDWSGAKGGSPSQKDGPYAAPRHWEATEEKKRLYVGGLPIMESQADCDQQVRELFAGFAIESVSKPIPPKPTADTKANAGNNHYCFADFKTPLAAKAAVEAMDGKEYRGGVLRVSFARSKSNKWEGRQDSSGWNRPREGEATEGVKE